MGQKADGIALTIAHFVKTYALTICPGLVNTSQCEFQIFAALYPHRPTTFRRTNFSYTRRGRLPDPHGDEGYSKVVPDLIGEVISPKDLAQDLFIKIEEYIRVGVPLIWVVNPKNRVVQVHYADGSGCFLGADAVQDGGDVLPGFQCLVSDLFKF